MELTSRRRVAARHLTSNPWHKPDWQAGYRILWCGILYSIPACQPAHSASRIDIDLPHQFRPGMMSLVNSRDASNCITAMGGQLGSVHGHLPPYWLPRYMLSRPLGSPPGQSVGTCRGTHKPAAGILRRCKSLPAADGDHGGPCSEPIRGRRVLRCHPHSASTYGESWKGCDEQLSDAWMPLQPHALANVS